VYKRAVSVVGFVLFGHPRAQSAQLDV